MDSKHTGNDLADASRYLEERLEKASVVCARFPGGIDFRNKNVVDIGSGLGALSIFAARQGARTVTGLEPNLNRMTKAEILLSRHAPELQNKVSFRNIGLEELSSGMFDIAVSMAVFEHVPDPHAALRRLNSHLKGDGKVYLGIGPLYRAPWGDHRRTKAPFQSIFPWSHLVFPEDWLIARRNKLITEEPVSSIRGLHLNCLRLDDYLSACEQSGMHLEWWKTNVTENRLLTSLLNLGVSLPGLRDLLAVNLYVVLCKRGSNAGPSTEDQCA